MNFLKKKILLVEDEVLVAMFEKQQLEKLGYSVNHVMNGEDAVRQALNTDTLFDVILMDIDLGSGIDGTQAAEEILKTKDTPIVFLSSHTEPEIVEKTEKITSYGYVVKNSGFVVLDASIKMALKLFDAQKERKRKEVELQETGTFLTSIYDGAELPIGVLDITDDGDFVITGINTAYERITGVRRVDGIGKRLSEFARLIGGELDLIQHLYERYRYCQQVGKTIQYEEFALLHGNESWWLTSLTPLRNSTERIYRIIVTTLNITDRKRSEEALRESELTFRKLFEDSADAILLIDKTGVFVECNQAALALLKMTREQFLFKPLVEISPEYQADGQSSREKALKMIEIAYKKGLNRFDWICINSEGIEFIVEVSLMPIKVKGELMLHTTWRDITERKKQEKELIILKEKAEESKKQFYKALEFSPIPIAVADTKGVILYLNRHFITTYGYTIQELQSIQDWFNAAYPDIEYRNFVINDWTKAVEEAVRDNLPTSVQEYNVTCKNGEVKTVAISAFFEEEYSIGIFNDITEKKKIEKEIYNQLVEKEILLKEIHHRVKNNILNIEGFLSLQIISHSNPDVKTILQDAISRVKSMRVLYENLLLSKDYQDVSMKLYIETIIKSVKEIYSDVQKVNIETRISDFSLPTKQATSLGIVINELLTNIIKYAFQNIENGQVLVILEKSSTNITLSVHDNGNGIDEQILLKESPGFGLKIIKLLTEQLKGTLTISNDNGTKSVLQFEI